MVVFHLAGGYDPSLPGPRFNPIFDGQYNYGLTTDPTLNVIFNSMNALDFIFNNSIPFNAASTVSGNQFFTTDTPGVPRDPLTGLPVTVGGGGGVDPVTGVPIGGGVPNVPFIPDVGNISPVFTPDPNGFNPRINPDGSLGGLTTNPDINNVFDSVWAFNPGVVAAPDPGGFGPRINPDGSLGGLTTNPDLNNVFDSVWAFNPAPLG